MKHRILGISIHTSPAEMVRRATGSHSETVPNIDSIQDSPSIVITTVQNNTVAAESSSQ
jgi:hypothetical protein